MTTELLKKAITSHFACNKNNLVCDVKFEDSVKAAKAFFLHIKGTQNDLFDSLIQKTRYKIKLKLINRYLHENG
jgi:hypothetical protein